MGRYVKLPKFFYFIDGYDGFYGPYLKKPNQKSIKVKLDEVIQGTPNVIGVISSNINDFLEWKIEQGLIPTGIDTKTKFQVDNTFYHCVNDIVCVRGHIYSGIIETKNGKERKDYQEILRAAMMAIKHL